MSNEHMYKGYMLHSEWSAMVLLMALGGGKKSSIRAGHGFRSKEVGGVYLNVLTIGSST